MNITLINPNIITQKSDFSGSGIPFIPISLAYKAAFLRNLGHEITVIDAFGENPKQIRKQKDLIIQGLTVEQITKRIPSDTNLIIVYASAVITHEACLNIIRAVKKKCDVWVLENFHSVVGYCIKEAEDDFKKAGANKLIPSFEDNLDDLPFPAWDLFPLENYWNLGYSHAPFKKKYLPILTSTGCFNNCNFCITPKMSKRIWKGRDPVSVVDEMECFDFEFNVKEFHVEDLNATTDRIRFLKICKEIIKRGLKVNIKLVAGFKAENLKENDLELMKQAGVSYISISPESGSKSLLKTVGKSFDYFHGIKLIKKASKLGIVSQACFIIGFPYETKKHIKLSRKYIKELVKVGLYELAIFMMIPIPGSELYKKREDFTGLTFSPKWREDYDRLSWDRFITYLLFFLWRLIYNPLTLLNKETKMFMAFKRVIKLNVRSWFN